MGDFVQSETADRQDQLESVMGDEPYNDVPADDYTDPYRTIDRIVDEFERLAEADRKHGERSRKAGDYGP